MKVLVTGGAGYIGSHTVVELVNAGITPVIADNFSNSRPEVLDRLAQITGRAIEHHAVDVTDRSALDQVFAKVKPEAVIHFAALKAVGESVAHPTRYYYNNLVSTLVLADTMVAHGVKRLVFSSTAAAYGEPERLPITEDARLAPTNPYGQTKIMGEQILRDVVVANPDWSVVLLRYFNPVGAHESGLIGEDPQGTPSNIMPLIAQVATGRRKLLQVWGDDYNTPDGTGVRDYLHVVDLARAHVRALDAGSGGVKTYNLGTGRGYSVLELVAAFEAASGRSVPYQVAKRRPGDVATCYADPSLAEQELGWTAEKTLEQMCADTWRWQSHNPSGYAAAH